MENIVNELKKRMPDLLIRENEPMSRHCSFQIGGPVRAMAFPSNADEAAELLLTIGELGEKPLIMGNGTNLLVTDKPLRRIAVKFGDRMNTIALTEGSFVSAQSGAVLARLASAAQAGGLGGLEFAHGIPGSVGGAVYMNAGAYGGEIAQSLRWVEYVSAAGEILRIDNTACGFAYRHSVFSENGGMIIRACFQLSHGDPDEIRHRMRELSAKRRTSQPLELPSAGSAFKRPAEGYAAALIDEAGLKGFSIGGAQVSPKHAGFIVNTGGASFDDVLRLIEHIRAAVHSNAGVLLEPEVKIIDNL